MKQYQLIALALFLSGLSQLYGQTISVSPTSLQALRDELLNSKVLLSNSEREVIELQRNLNEAKESQMISAGKIADLETRLNEALSEQERLRNRIVFLESRLTALLESLTALQKDLDAANEKHIQDVKYLVSRYEKRLKVYKIAVWVLGSVVVGGVTYAGLNALK